MKPHKYHCILTAFYGTPWAIDPNKLDVIEAALLARVFGDIPDPSFIDRAERLLDRGPRAETDDDDDDEAQAKRQGPVMVIPVRGTITPRPSLFSSGGTSAEGLGRNIDAAAANDAVRHIVLDIDSPGGSVFGTEETANKIRAARDRKPVYAVASPMAASAAYWFASQASKLYVAPSGMVGSIGVISRHFDQSERLKKEGVNVTTITSGKYKDEGNPYQPLNDEAKAELQKQSGQWYAKFLRGVADGRGVDTETVREKYGQGRMFQADDAVKNGLADGITTVEALVKDLKAADHRRRVGVAAMAFAAAEGR